MMHSARYLYDGLLPQRLPPSGTAPGRMLSGSGSARHAMVMSDVK
jgi:hypothetical protein